MSAGILHRVVPLRAGTALRGVEPVAREDHDRHAVDPRVVDGHRRMLQSHGAVDGDTHGLAGGLRVAVRHRDGRFLVHAGEELRHPVAAVVDEGLVQAAEARAGVGGHVVEAERLDDVDHEVGAGAIDDVGFVIPVGLAVIPAQAGIHRGSRLRGSDGVRRGGHERHRGGGARSGHRRLQERAAIHAGLLLLVHRIPPPARVDFCRGKV